MKSRSKASSRSSLHRSESVFTTKNPGNPVAGKAFLKKTATTCATSANGLAFLASDMAVHELLGARTVVTANASRSPWARSAATSGDFRARLLAIDPHRVRSFSKRHMRRHRLDEAERPTKISPTFFVLDADTHQPVCFTTGTSARTATTAAEELLELAAHILDTQPGQTLVLADAEHFTVELLDKVKTQTNFDLLVPMPDQPSLRKKLQACPRKHSDARWAGYATTKMAYTPGGSQAGPFFQYVQRLGERPEEYHFKAFLSTRDGDEVEGLTLDFPKRWHVEEFFNAPSGVGLGPSRDMQSEHQVRADVDGPGRSSSDRSAS